MINNESIHPNYNLSKNETIKLEFSENSYNSFNCNLQYSYKITEPEINEYNKYYINYDGNDDDSSSFEKEEYIGRLTYYKIILKEDLSHECNNTNCILCFNNNKDFCLKCISKYTYSENGLYCLENTPTTYISTILTTILETTEIIYPPDTDTINNSSESNNNSTDIIKNDNLTDSINEDYLTNVVTTDNLLDMITENTEKIISSTQTNLLDIINIFR